MHENRPGVRPPRAGRAALCLLAWASWTAAEEPAAAFRFGQAELGERLEYRFELPNAGPVAMDVKGATPSCDCVQILRWTPMVEPGDTGSMDVAFVPDRIGMVDYRVVVKAFADEQPVAVFAIQGEVVGELRPPEPRDWSLYVDLNAASAWAGHPDKATWVDVRGTDLYEQAHVPGALSIPLHTVKTKPFLRLRRTVLMDEGGGSRQLEEECRRLRVAGFADLWIWYGGVNVWQLLGGGIEGRNRARIDRLPASALSDIAQAEDWLVVSTSGDMHGVARAVAIPLIAGESDEFASELRAALGKRPEVKSVLIVSEKGELPESLREAASGADGFLFQLEGGWAAWSDYRRVTESHSASRLAVSQPSSARPQSRGGCGRCSR